MLSQVGQFSVQFFDTAIVGHLGSTPLAGVAFAGNVYFFFYILGTGITVGITPIVGELYAQGKYRNSASFFQNSILVYLLLGLLICGLQLGTIPFFRFMGQSDNIIQAAIPYYCYLSFSSIPLMIFYAFKQFLEGIGNTKVSMIIVIGTNVINIILNYILIYGKLGLPTMEAAGAGLATLIARSFMVMIIIGYFVYNDSVKRYIIFFNKRYFSINHIKKLLNIGFPISFQMTLEGSAFAFTGIMMGWFGDIVLAANQTAIIIANVAFLIITSIGSATTIRVSHVYAKRDLLAIKRITISSYHITIIWNIITIIMFVTLRNYLPLIFNSDPKVVKIVATFLIFVSIYQISDGIQGIAISVLRGVQQVRITSIVAFIAYMLINLPVGYFLAFVFGFGPNGLWFGYIFGLTVAAIVLNRKCRSIKI
jgi:MATE family multidrug resistance protein